MRIAYLLHIHVSPPSGILDKVLSQLAYWRNAGHSSMLFALTRSPDLHHFLLSQRHESILYTGSPHSRARAAAFIRLHRLVASWSPDVVYMRRDFVNSTYITLARTYPIVHEINAHELSEIALKNKLYALYHWLTRPVLDRLLAGMVFVTHELASLPYFRTLPVWKAVIPNSIQLALYRPCPLPTSQQPALAFLGFPEPWHGIDKLFFLASLTPTWQFHLVGPARTSFSHFPPNVQFHGPLGRAQYTPILAACHVGIGPLALHRKRMSEACPLKVREYLAHGLPVVIAHTDPDFPSPTPFILQLPNREDNIAASLARLNDFVHAWLTKRVHPQQIRHLDISVKEQQRLRFFSCIATKTCQRSTEQRTTCP